MRHVKRRSNIHFLKARLERVHHLRSHCQAKQDVINLSHACPPLLFLRCMVSPLISVRLESVRWEDLLDFLCSPSRGTFITMASEHLAAVKAPVCSSTAGIFRSDVPGGLQKFPALCGGVSLLRENLPFVFSQILPLLKSTALRGRFCRSVFTPRIFMLSRQKCNLVTEIINPFCTSQF